MYKNIRKSIHLKNGGRIPKFDRGSVIQKLVGMGYSEADADVFYSEFGDEYDYDQFRTTVQEQTLQLNKAQLMNDEGLNEAVTELNKPSNQIETISARAQQLQDESEDSPDGPRNFNQSAFDAMSEDKNKTSNAKLSAFGDKVKSGLSLFGGKGGSWQGVAANAGVAAMNALDNATMGNKNFGAQSQAIDAAVHGTSKALMSTGNPYAIAAGAALEGANFLTKAGGQTVQGFDVPINNSGYGNLGHMESSSSRDFGAMIGLGGLNRRSLKNKLAKRNEQARMALAAQQISEDTKFEQEARMNSIQNTITNNQIALAGGIDTSLLGA